MSGEFLLDWGMEVVEEGLQATAESGGKLIAREFFDAENVRNEDLWNNIKEQTVGAGGSMFFATFVPKGIKTAGSRLKGKFFKMHEANLKEEQAKNLLADNKSLEDEVINSRLEEWEEAETEAEQAEILKNLDLDDTKSNREMMNERLAIHNKIQEIAARIETGQAKTVNQAGKDALEEIEQPFENPFVTPELEQLNPEKAVEMLKTSLPHATIEQVGTGIQATLKNGEKITIELYDNIPNEPDADGAYFPKSQIIALAGDATQETVNHETFHAAEQLVLNEKDIAFLSKKGFADPEARAERYASWQLDNGSVDSKTGKIFQKIKDFFANLLQAVGIRSERGVYNKAQKGKALNKSEMDVDILRMTNPQRTKIHKKIESFIKEIDSSELTQNQQGIKDVVTGDKKVHEIQKEDLGYLDDVVHLKAGSKSQGAKHIIIRHYNENVGTVTAQEILSIADIITHNTPTVDSTGAHIYETIADDGTKLKVVVGTDKKSGHKKVITFYGNNDAARRQLQGAKSQETTAEPDLYGQHDDNIQRSTRKANPDCTAANLSVINPERNTFFVLGNLRT